RCAVKAAGAEGKPCDLDAGPSQRDPIGCRGALRAQGECADAGQRARGQPGTQKISSGVLSHRTSSNGLARGRQLPESYHKSRPARINPNSPQTPVVFTG